MRSSPNVSVEQGKASGERVLPDYAFVNGDAAKAIAAAPFRSSGTLHIGGQEHFYLEGQVALAVPGEDGAMLVYSSTQHPSEVQHVVARVLGAAGFLRDLHACAAWAAALAARRRKRRSGRSLPLSPRAPPAGPASSGSTAMPTWS